MTLFLTLLLVGCVPKKQYEALDATFAETRSELEQQLAERDSALSEKDQRIRTLEAAVAAEQQRVHDLETQAIRLQAQIDALNAEKANLLRDKSSLKASVTEMQEALKDLAARKAQAETRIAEYKSLLGRFQKLIDAGRLRVKIADGRMVVEMATDILFASGKAELSADGKAALLEVAQVLASIPDRAYQVEGHTDNVRIATDRYPSNWELASARAIVVVRTLVEGGVSTDRVSAASFADTRPVADNATPEGKTANRRIEIVVVPDLAQLPGFEELREIAGE